MPYLIAESSLLDNTHTNVQHIFHQLLALAGFTILLFCILASAHYGCSKNFQVLGFNSNTNHLAISFLKEALLEQALNDSFQLALDASFEDEWNLDIRTGLLGAGMGAVHPCNFLPR
jgi:hypothetical protein